MRSADPALAIVITGVSSGIGRETARHAIARGAQVFGTVRTQGDAAALSTELGERFTPLLVEIRDEATVLAGAERVRAALAGRRLSGLVNNAAVAIPGPVLFQPLSEIREQIETDLIGTIVVTRAFAPLLGADRTLSGPPGRIVMVSSIGGRIGQPFLSGYIAAKHGIEGFSETLRRELQLFGIDVVIVGPAPVDTPIWDKGAAQLGRYAGTPYGEAFDRGVSIMVEQGHRHSLAPARVAETIWTALTARRPKARYAPAKHLVIEQGLARLLPRRWLDRLFGRVLRLRPRRR
ncbi:SDR family NAD(P)-dependent oxidoreductase [Methylobacterium soli]|uniref:SDR family NAD(P)-dependent oxidoreductase n=1 Tax=Methylobacterium soli TaxID=553447 RepID=A0A6L3SUR7_9HYPH|nr:SDR family NAD(P)-dependent oxidoreductase [Methylobacterium soli]